MTSMDAAAEPQLAPPAADDWLACTTAILDPGVASAWVVRPDTGAAVTFTGTARDHAGDRTGVHLLEYEAYDEQVVPVLARVAQALRARHPDVARLALWHRTGGLAVTEVAVVVAVSAPSSLAVQFAAESGQTLAGFARADRMNLYAHPERVLLPGRKISRKRAPEHG